MGVWRVVLPVVAVLVGLPAGSAGASERFEAVFLSVGQGDAALYRGPCGEVGLIDANRGAVDEVLGQLDAWGPRSALKWVNTSHYDADHLGDVEDVGRAEGVALEAVYDRGGGRNAKDTQTYRSYYDWATGAGIRQPVAIGESFSLCSGEQQVTFEVVSVGTDGTTAGGVPVSEENDKGVCVHTEYGDLDLASCGDVNGTDEGSRADVESAVAPAYGDVEVAKVNHHGSKFSSNPSYVSALSAELAVSSVGANSFGHPAAEVIQRWDQHGDVTQTETADGAVKDGAISIATAAGSTIEAHASGSDFAASYTADEGGGDGGGPTATARDIADGCPKDRIREDNFTDVAPSNPHELAIDCVASWQITQGTTHDTYSPAGRATRAQMATFLTRLVLQSGGELPAQPGDHFPDDEGNPHEDNINRLAEAGLVAGAGQGYHPDAVVSRAQMATFLTRATNYRLEGELPAGADYFADDDGTPHEGNINTAAEAGVTAGQPDGTYGTSAPVRRDQMGSFLARVLDLLVEEGLASPPGPTSPQLRITDVVADPAGDDVQPEDGEYVELANPSDDPVDLTGWYLLDEAENRLDTCALTLEPGATVRIYTGPGANTAERCYNDRGAAVLNNDGDTLRLFNATDQQVDIFAY